jgi:succinyl-diaminopimelate desuccinylase
VARISGRHRDLRHGDEETGGYGGVAWLAEQGYFSPERVQHVIIPEPLNKDRICLGAPRRDVGGDQDPWPHRPWLDAVSGRLRRAPYGRRHSEMEASLFPALARKHTAMPVVPDGARQSTMNINSLHGGQAEPEPGFTGFPAACVPDEARMVIDRRYIIEEQPDEVREEIIALLERVKSERPGFRYDFRSSGRSAPP